MSAPYSPTTQRSVADDELASEGLLDDGGAQTVGAPVEQHNPLGYSVTLTSAVMLNVSEMIGVGIYSTSGSVLKSVGSTGMFLVYWLLGPLIGLAGLTVYNELASIFPKRSGAEVVYLEQAFPRPRFLMSITYAVCTISLPASAINSIVFAEYTLDAFGIPHTAFRQTVLAIGITSLGMGLCAASTKWSLRVVNTIAFVKVATLFFFVATGACVLLGLTPISDPLANFERPFEDTTSSVNALAVGLVKINYAFLGWANANKVAGEVRGKDPIRTVRRAGYIALAIVATLYFLVIVSYVAAVPKDQIKDSGQLVAAVFLRAVYGNSFVQKLLPLLIACSCFGTLVAATTAHARVIREVARQGFLPWGKFFGSTKPWGTPLGPILLKYSFALCMLLLSPAQDAFLFLVDVASYPPLVFTSALTIGVWVLRKRRMLQGLPAPAFQAWNVVVWFFLIKNSVLLVMPWVPPEGGSHGGDVSLWYATYCVVGLGILALCGIYYYFWVVLLPKWGEYDIVEEVVDLPDGARIKRITRRYHHQRIPRENENSPLLAQT